MTRMNRVGGISSIALGCLLTAALGAVGTDASGQQAGATPTSPSSPSDSAQRSAVAGSTTVAASWPPKKVFKNRILVAYYGTANTGSLGVLGEAPPDKITKRLRKAAAPFATKSRKVQIVYELIVTVADADAGTDGDYSHDIPRSSIETYGRRASTTRCWCSTSNPFGRASSRR
jgi:hypothetical protein